MYTRHVQSKYNYYDVIKPFFNFIMFMVDWQIYLFIPYPMFNTLEILVLYINSIIYLFNEIMLYVSGLLFLETNFQSWQSAVAIYVLLFGICFKYSVA